MVIARRAQPNRALIQGWDGASYFAAKSGLPIIPVGVTGSGDKEVVNRLKRFKRLDLKANVGKPFTLPRLEGKSTAMNSWQPIPRRSCAASRATAEAIRHLQRPPAPAGIAG